MSQEEWKRHIFPQHRPQESSGNAIIHQFPNPQQISVWTQELFVGSFFFFFFFWTVGRLQITNLKATDFSKKRQQVAFTACFLYIFFNTHSVKGLSFIFSYLLLCLCIYTSLRLVLRSLGVITEGFICRDRAVFQANQD